jgi:serine/threonine-protein kinase RsbW
MPTCAHLMHDTVEHHPDAGNHTLASIDTLADTAGLAACLQLTTDLCERLALADDDAQAIRLAVEEACTNVVNHGYAGQAVGPLALSFHLADDDCLQARIRDKAKPFHPDEAPEPDLLSESSDRPIGGLGWFFIKQVMTSVAYASDSHGNCLFLTRKLTRATTIPPTESK